MADVMLPSDRIELGWCQHFPALTPEGMPAPPTHGRASAWCPYAAISLWAGIKHKWRERYCKLAFAITGRPLVDWADDPNRSRQQVVTVMRRVEEQMGVR